MCLNKKYKYILAALVAVVVVFVLVVNFLNERDCIRQGKAEAISRTKQRMDFFSNIVEIYAKNNEKFPITTRSVIEWGKSAEWGESVENDDIVVAANLSYLDEYIDTNNDLLDDYNKPIIIIKEKDGQYCLMSYGYNGKDDKGLKDDIVQKYAINKSWAIDEENP